jgi:hypothetical protein
MILEIKNVELMEINFLSPHFATNFASFSLTWKFDMEATFSVKQGNYNMVRENIHFHFQPHHHHLSSHMQNGYPTPSSEPSYEGLVSLIVGDEKIFSQWTTRCMVLGHMHDGDLYSRGVQVYPIVKYPAVDDSTTNLIKYQRSLNHKSSPK